MQKLFVRGVLHLKEIYIGGIIAYYGNMFKQLKDVKDKNYDLQINYQKFYELCDENEKKKLDEIIKKGGN